MKKATIISLLLILLYGLGHALQASYDNGGGLDYVMDSQNFGIHTTVVPEALTLNGYFAFKEQTSDDAPASGYGNLYAKDDGLYYYNGSTAFLLTNGTGVAIGINDLTDAKVANTTSVFIGSGSGASVAGGTSNVALGTNSLNSLTSAVANVAIGAGSLQNNQTGANNVAIGLSSLSVNTAQDNIAIGTSALQANIGGVFNVAIGSLAINTNSAGNNNVAVGYHTLRGTTGSQNTAIGTTSLFSNTGSSNTATGFNALYNNLAGSDNTASGDSSLSNVTTGSGNTAMGTDALEFPNAGSSANTAVGYQAGHGTTTNAFSNSSFLGYQTGVLLTTGSNNLLLGYKVGDLITTGANNIVIGYDIDTSANSASNELIIGNLIYGTAIDGTGTTKSSGNIGIGDSSPEAKLKVNGTVLATAFNGDGSALTGVVMSPGGSTTQIQYNNGGTLSGDANLSWDNALNKISVAGNGSFSTGIYLPGNIGIYRSSDVGNNTYFSFPGEDKARITVGDMYAMDVQESNDDRITMGLTSAGVRDLEFFNLNNTLYLNGDAANGAIFMSIGSPVFDSNFKLLVQGSVGPNTDAAYDLGSSSNRWQDLYTSSANVSYSDESSNSHLSILQNANGDATMNFRLTAATNGYAMGVDNSDGDKFKISYAGSGIPSLGTSDRFTIDTTGNVGIGDSSPSAKLQVAGDILLGNSSATCDGTTEGSQRYNSTDKRMEFCDATSWRDFASSGKPSFFHVHRNGTDWTTLTQNTDYTIDWTTESYDYNTEFDLTTEKFTPTSSGLYLIVLKARVLAVDVDSFAIAKINLNGSTVAMNVETIGSSSVAASVTTVSFVHMNGSTDYVTGIIRHNSSSSKDLSGLATDTYMMGVRVMD